MQAPLLLAADLTVRYPGPVMALDALDLDGPGQGITCLLGANGAGKTTLIEAACGLRHRTSGRLEVRGRAPGDAANRLSLGVMLQEDGLPGGARPREFLEYLARLYPQPRDVPALLESVEIDPGTRTPMRRLSGGQARRVAWAAAMVGRPTALLLDEPTAGVDPVGRERLREVLETEARSGVAMVVSTHLIEDVEAFADFVVVLRHGRAVLTGRPEELRPRNSLVVKTARPMDERLLLAALPAGSTSRRSTDGSYLVEVPSGIDPAVMATVSSWCAQHSITADLAVADLRSVLWDALRGDRT